MFLSKEVKIPGFMPSFVWGMACVGPGRVSNLDLQHSFTAGKGIKLFTYIICHLENKHRNNYLSQWFQKTLFLKFTS